MARPTRIQRKRTRGWRMPGAAVYVGRPTKWGNPYVVRRGIIGTSRCGRVPRLVYGWRVSTPGGAVLLFRDRERAVIAAVEHFSEALREGRLAVSVDDVRRELRGKTLACWCRVGSPCHATALLEVANG